MPTECDICGRVCAGERRLNEHIQRKHKTSFKCKNCDEVGLSLFISIFLSKSLRIISLDFNNCIFVLFLTWGILRRGLWVQFLIVL